MAASLADRATSDLLISPDWAMNVEICDILNRDPGQAKNTARVLRRRMGHKNPKIQLLALTLLETIIKNCGDIVHLHVAERDIPHKMVKIVKKKSDFHVKEKILLLIDTWQEAFGGPHGRHPQYFAAYQELLRAGIVFPKRVGRSAPVFVQQGKPSTSCPQPLEDSDCQREATESSVSTELAALSLADIQNARGIMDVLAEMLNALDPKNKEGTGQEVIVDLVQQCRSYRQRLVHLVNTTSDEKLLSEGLPLNDDLQRLLAKHDAIASGVALNDKKPKTLQALVNIDDSTVTNQDNNAQGNPRPTTSSSSQPLFQQLLQPGSAAPDCTSNPPAIRDTFIDFLSGENTNAPSTDNSLALVPINEPLADSTPNQNIFSLSVVFSQNNDNSNSNNPSNGFDSHSASHLALVPVASQYPPQPPQTSQPSLYSSAIVPSHGISQHEQVGYSQGNKWALANSPWNGQSDQVLNLQQQAYNDSPTDLNGALPPPPWEAQPENSDQLTSSQHPQVSGGQSGTMNPESLQGSFPGSFQPPLMQNGQPERILPTIIQSSQQMDMYPSNPVGGAYPQVMPNPHLRGACPQPMPNGQLGGVYPQQMPNGQLGGAYPQPMPNGQFGGTYPQQMANDQLKGAYPQPMPGSQLGGAYPPAMAGSQIGGAYSQAMPAAQVGAKYPQAMSGAQFGGYAYGQQPEAQFYYQRPTYPHASPTGISQGMYGLSLQDNNTHANSNLSYQMSTTASYVHQPIRPSKPEDKLFGDLVSLAKTKPNKPTV